MEPVLHSLTSADQPQQAVAAVPAALAPGSAVAISHPTADGTDPLVRLYRLVK